jgi:3-oxoacyl-[acyl-carrier protein] reductase
MSHFSLQGKRALVTGGTRGIGKAIAQELKQAGAEVIITGRDVENTRKIAQELGMTGIAADMADKAAIDSLIQEVGAVDILVNNAGIIKDGMFARQSEDQWEQVLNVNLNATVHLTRGLLTSMSQKNWGRVVNITSVVAHMGNVGQTNYVTSKAAVTGFAKALSKEVARKGITVNCVAPGFIETDMTAGIPEQIVENFRKTIPMHTFGKPEDIAAAVRFLVSDEARYVTGTTLHVNGGLYL